MRRVCGANGDTMMLLAASADAARPNRRRGAAADGVTFWHTLYIGTSRYNMAPGTADPAPDALFPMAFLVEQDPGSIANSHYHQQDQFQVVVDGSGVMGTHEVGPVTVHFAGAYTAYGPIRAHPVEGVTYFTLRNGFDPGARFMADAENRTALRHVQGRVHREAVAGLLPVSSGPTVAVLGPDADGMGAWRYRLAAHERAVGEEPSSGRGQYWVVLAGGMQLGGELLPARSCVFVGPQATAFTVAAGPDGLDVLAMQFPRRRQGENSAQPA
jgi:hypothetical protein